MSTANHSFLADRFEFKYVLDRTTAIALERYFQTIGLVPDDNSREGSYTVNSLYYDSKHLDDYRDKDGSLLIRKKMRARMYSDFWDENFSTVWMEIKHKRNMVIFKRRAGIPKADWQLFMEHGLPHELTKSGANEHDRGVLSEFAYLYIKEQYRPHVIVKYSRRAYLAKFLSSVRITFDKDIQTCWYGDRFNESFMIPVYQDKVVMEVKYKGKLPWWFTLAITKFELRRSDFSKYNNSVAKLREHYRMPVNK